MCQTVKPYINLQNWPNLYGQHGRIIALFNNPRELYWSWWNKALLIVTYFQACWSPNQCTPGLCLYYQSIWRNAQWVCGIQPCSGDSTFYSLHFFLFNIFCGVVMLMLREYFLVFSYTLFKLFIFLTRHHPVDSCTFNSPSSQWCVVSNIHCTNVIYFELLISWGLTLVFSWFSYLLLIKSIIRYNIINWKWNVMKICHFCDMTSIFYKYFWWG